MPSAYVVYNPMAGRYPSHLLTEHAARLLRENGWQVQLLKTESGEHLTQLAHQAAEQDVDAFFVVGGDGSINQAIEGLVDSQTALGVLPAGTANVWAQELGLPGLSWTRWMALEESARRLLTAKVRQVDVGWCNGKHFLLWAGVGLDGFIVHRIEPRNRWEKHFAVVHYAASAVWNASMWHGIELRVFADGKKIEGHFLLGVVSNVHLYAGGFANLSPDARLDDGQMDLWLFPGETLGDTVQLAWDLVAGAHLNSDRVMQIPFQSLRLESETPIYLQLDGEPHTVSHSVEIKVRPQALRVLTPEPTPQMLFSDQSNWKLGEDHK